MTKIAIMIEGQNGLTWERWKRIAQAVEDLGFAGLFRSDHFTNMSPPDRESLELWISLAWLASHTQRIEFGPLVSPVSFRHPVFTARMGRDVDDLSGGRLLLGIGAGWQEREHTNFGFDLLGAASRFDRFEEGVQIIRKLLESDEPVNFEGEYYRLKDAILLPRPQCKGGPPILIGGNGRKRTLPIVARYADMWNAVYIPAGQYEDLNVYLDELLDRENRKAGDVHRSIMTGCYFGRDDGAVQAKLDARQRSFEEARKMGVIVGTGSQIVDQLGELAEAGARCVMLQWLDLDDLDGLEAMAKSVLPQMAG